MLEAVLNYMHNWFVIPGAARAGTFIIVSGALSLPHVQEGQYYKIEGSVFNDGLHKYGDEDYKLKDETFIGRIVPLAVPRAVVELAERIKTYCEKNPETDKVSESFGGYSYTRGTGTNGAAAGGWQAAFCKELNVWKKVC